MRGGGLHLHKPQSFSRADSLPPIDIGRPGPVATIRPSDLQVGQYIKPPTTANGVPWWLPDSSPWLANASLVDLSQSLIAWRFTVSDSYFCCGKEVERKPDALLRPQDLDHDVLFVVGYQAFGAPVGIRLAAGNDARTCFQAIRVIR
jgi:hypothetical protein